MPLIQDSLYLGHQLLFVGHVQDIPGGKDVVFQPAQSVLRRDTIFVCTKDDANRRVIVGVVDLGSVVVQVHIDLPCRFWSQLGGFQLDEHTGPENLVEKHHVHIVVGVVQRDSLLGTYKHEASPQLQHELLDLLHQGTLQVTLHHGFVLGQSQKFKHIGVSDDILWLGNLIALRGQSQDLLFVHISFGEQ